MVEGLSGPEAVRWDPDQRVWFVSNFAGSEPGDGFVSRVASDGAIESLRFIVGDDVAPLDDPRGMVITGDTLWVADADGVHGFHRRSAARLAFVDFTEHEPGFLNDIAQGPDGRLWVTDTGRSRLYRIAEGQASIALEDPGLGPPNGITWDAAGARFLLAPWRGVQTIRAWAPGSDTVEEIATSSGGNFDGIELVGRRIVLASQADSSLHVLDPGAAATRPFIRVAGRPADIGVDPEGGRVAVPYIALDRVDIWRLPGG